MKRIIYLSLVLVCLYYSASAQVPQTLTYQGFLTENDIPVTTPRDITLTLLHGPAVKHTETFTSQTVDKGLFTVTLGNVPGNELPGDIDTWKNELTVEIKVNNVVMGNPVPLTTVPYSFMASHVDNVHVQDLADGSLTGTKVNPNFGSQNISTTGMVTATSFSGSGASLTSLSVSSSEIDDGAIVNADINAGAAIADTKLATIITAGKVSGNAITSGTIGGNTAINTSGSITAASFTGSGAGLTSLAVAGSEIDDGTLMNVDINANAAIADTKLATISSSGKVLNSATTATNANTANAIVSRDASGNFTAGTITAALIGNASTVTTNANLTGDVTSTGNTTSIASGVIVNADVNASAAIAGTKVSPDFGSQNIVTTSTLTGSDFNYGSTKTRNVVINQAAFTLVTSNVAVFSSRLLTSGIPYLVRAMGGTYGNAASLNAPIFLPEGATVTSVAATLYDGDATYNITVILARSSWTSLGTTSNMASVVSSGSAGGATLTTSSITNPVIDNSNYGYFILFQTVEAGANHGLYNVKITYTINKAD